MRLTLHSARLGGGRHNDRNFDISQASHIVESESNKNIYLNYLGDDNLSFHESEVKFYQDYFKDFINDKNERTIKAGHSERIVDAEDLLKSSRYRPEEVIIQIGDKDSTIDSKELIGAFSEFLKWHDNKFKDNIKTLNIALHVDLSNAKKQAKSIIQTASEQSLSLNEKVKLAKYEQLVGDDKLRQLEDQNKHHARQRTRDINKDLER